MKILFENYSFNAASKQITFNTTDVIGLENLLLITNVTNNTIIYNFADSTKGGTISNNVLTLTYNTTGMSSTDILQIFLDNTLTPASEESLQYLKKIVQLLTPLATQDSSQRQRITIDNVSQTATSGTAGALLVTQASAPNLQVTANQAAAANLNANVNIITNGGVDPRYQIIDAARLTYAQGIRRNLTFS